MTTPADARRAALDLLAFDAPELGVDPLDCSESGWERARSELARRWRGSAAKLRESGVGSDGDDVATAVEALTLGDIAEHRRSLHLQNLHSVAGARLGARQVAELLAELAALETLQLERERRDLAVLASFGLEPRDSARVAADAARRPGRPARGLRNAERIAAELEQAGWTLERAHAVAGRCGRPTALQRQARDELRAALRQIDGRRPLNRAALAGLLGIDETAARRLLAA
jgi:hypothetical protein